MTVTTYRINKSGEETACDYCGTPLYKGDKVYAVGSRAYCSQDCAFLFAELQEQRAQAQTERERLINETNTTRRT